VTPYREPTLSPPAPPRWHLDVGVALTICAARVAAAFTDVVGWLVAASGALRRGLASAGRAIALGARIANGVFVGSILGGFAGLFVGGSVGSTLGAIYGAGIGAVLGGGSLLFGVLLSVGFAALVFGLHVAMLVG
jgi:hypothetical protein